MAHRLFKNATACCSRPTSTPRASGQHFLPPDILTNAGGVTVSYFEWVQDLGRLFWTRDEIRAKLAEKLSDAFDRVWDLAEEREVSLRTAALVLGHSRGLEATQARAPSVNLVRDAMVSHPGRLASDASAQAAGELLQRPEVRAIYVTEEDRLVGVVTRKTLVREVVAAGRDPNATTSRHSPSRPIPPSAPTWHSRTPFASARSTTPSVSPSSTASGG